MREQREELVVANPIEVLNNLDAGWIAWNCGQRR